MNDLNFDSPATVLLALLVSVLAGLVRGFAGFGGPAVMFLLLTQLFNPLSVVLKVMLIDIVANTHLVPASAREVDWRTTTPLIVATLLSMPLGMYALEVVDPALVKRVVAGVVGGCTLLLLLGFRYRRPAGQGVLVLVGVAGGVVFGASYLVLVVVVFLLAGPDRAAVSRANIIMWAFVISLVFIATHALLGRLALEAVAGSLALGIVYTLASALGTRWFRRTGERRYRRLVLWLLVGLSALGVLT